MKLWFDIGYEMVTILCNLTDSNDYWYGFVFAVFLLWDQATIIVLLPAWNNLKHVNKAYNYNYNIDHVFHYPGHFLNGIFTYLI